MVGSLFEQVGLPPRRRDDYPHELSGGQKQRVMIAMALACNPSMVIADEPTTALDVMVQAQVLRLMKQLQRDLGLSMIFITHDLSVLVEVADRLAVMYAGRIIEEGPAEHVFHDPKHPYTAALAAAFPEIGDPRFRGKPSGLGGDPPDPQAIPAGCSFNPRCPVGLRGLPSDRPRALRRRPRATRRLPARARRPCRRRGGRHVSAEVIPASPTTMGPPVVEVRDLKVQFKTRVGMWAGIRGQKPDIARAVDGATLTLHEGEVLALAGESGCGKTTLARAIMGLIPPAEGEIYYQGEPLGRGKTPEGLPAGRPDGLPGPDRVAQPSLDDLRDRRRGPADPRHPRGAERRDRGGAGRASPLARGDAAARTLLPALPARALGRAAPARGDRGRARPGSVGDRRGRTGLEPRCVGAGRDPRAAHEAARRDEDLGPDRDARPRARVDDGRPRSRDVPRPRRRARPGRGRPPAPQTSVHEGAARRRPRGGRPRATGPRRRGARSDPDSRRAAGSTHAARWWPRGARPSSGSRSACRGTDIAITESGTDHVAACHLVPLGQQP